MLRAGCSRDARTKVDKTPLHIAAYEGHANICRLLLKVNYDPYKIYDIHLQQCKYEKILMRNYERQNERRIEKNVTELE